MYVVDPIGKTAALRHRPVPPLGARFSTAAMERPEPPPAMPDAAGHFDYLEPGTPEFEMAQLYGCVRFVLDVWEHYFGRPIAWHFLSRLRGWKSPSADLNNATAGYGFLELGANVTGRRDISSSA